MAKTCALLALLTLLSAVACTGGRRRQNPCPIDGQPPQWSGPRKGDSCEYFHYSIIEKKTHSWWVDCKLDSPK
jgi:hypothetical protein